MILRRILRLVTLLIAGTHVGSARADDDTALRLSNVSSGNTAYVRVANDAAFTLPVFTLEAWVQRAGPGYGGTTDALGAAIIAKPIEGQTGSYLGSWHLNWTNSGRLVFTVVHTAASSGVFLTTPAVATPLGRHHLAATFDGDTLRAFLDGVLAAQAFWGLGTVHYGSDDVLIGGQNFGSGYFRRFDGFIDDVRVWNYARTPAQIAAEMNCHLSGNETGLVAYWPFDAFDLSDATGHGHGGMIGGLPGSLAYSPLESLLSCTQSGVDESTSPLIAPPMLIFPQPTRGPVTVRFDLPREGIVSLDLFDVSGRKVGSLASRHFPAGRHELVTDITAQGLTIPGTGLFYMRLNADGRRVTRPLVLVR